LFLEGLVGGAEAEEGVFFGEADGVGLVDLGLELGFGGCESVELGLDGGGVDYLMA